jgi:plastocyanin
MTWDNLCRAAALTLWAFAGVAAPGFALAQDAVEITITVKNRTFDPARIEVPADKPIKLTVKNLDATPMEFESKSLRVEKIVTANNQGIVNIRAQKAGEYEFFDDFHKETRGLLVVK